MNDNRKRQRLLRASIVLVFYEVSYRDAATMMGLSPWALYYFIYRNLKSIDPELYHKVRLQLIKNAERWRGEQAYDLRPMD